MTKVFVKNSNLFIPKPNFVDDFLSTIFVYACEKLQNQALLHQIRQLKNYIKVGKASTDKLVLQANDTVGLRNKSIEGWNIPVPDNLQANHKLTVIVFVLNEVNGYKRISNATRKLL